MGKKVQKKSVPKNKKLTVAQWLIEKTDTAGYRAGTLTGWKHLTVDGVVMELVGGRKNFIEQARRIDKEAAAGWSDKIKFGWGSVNTDIRKVDYAVAVIAELCHMEGIEDPREHQLKLISNVQFWRKEAGDCAWLLEYYDDILSKLEKGIIKEEAEDTLRFQCINAIAVQRKPVWERVFSARVFGDSKAFKNKGYRAAALTVLRNYSPYYVDGMSDDELLDMHEIHSYAQIIEWKGPLQYQIDHQTVIDTAANCYGTVINTQTMEHSVPYALPGCKRIMTIENKANYESMTYADDTLYIFCHGFFTPKEVRFLKQICEIVPEDCEFYHWGDMDFGGIGIFQFTKGNVFPKLLPYKMGVDDFKAAVEAGAGIELEAQTRKKLEHKEAGLLSGLKDIILQKNLTIEQERLL